MRGPYICMYVCDCRCVCVFVLLCLQSHLLLGSFMCFMVTVRLCVFAHHFPGHFEWLCVPANEF